jgi:carboxylesterase
MSMLLTGGEPFYIPGGKIGCLLVHGFSGSPYEMRLMGEALAGQSLTVLGVRLFGHATQPKDMIRSRWQDWAASVVDGWHLLQESCEQVFIMGLSLGGALALFLGSQLPVAGIVAMSTPYAIPDERMEILRPLVPLISKIIPFAPKRTGSWKDPAASKGYVEYPREPIRSGLELDRMLAKMRTSLPEISAPTLMIHSRGDGSVPVEHAEKLHAIIGADEKELFWLEESGHVVTRDSERELVFQKVYAWIEQVSRMRIS